jgi:disulfide bond formation protein DsbB
MDSKRDRDGRVKKTEKQQAAGLLLIISCAGLISHFVLWYLVPIIRGESIDHLIRIAFYVVMICSGILLVVSARTNRVVLPGGILLIIAGGLMSVYFSYSLVRELTHIPYMPEALENILFYGAWGCVLASGITILAQSKENPKTRIAGIMLLLLGSSLVVYMLFWDTPLINLMMDMVPSEMIDIVIFSLDLAYAVSFVFGIIAGVMFIKGGQSAPLESVKKE